MLFNNNLTHHNAYSSMNIFSCRFFASLVWYLTHDVAVCSGGGGDFGRSFCQLPPSPSYPGHDSLEEWRSIFQIQDPQYLLQRSLKILKFLIALPQLSYYIIICHVPQVTWRQLQQSLYMLYMFYSSILIAMLRWNVFLHIMQQKISSVNV